MCRSRNRELQVDLAALAHNLWVVVFGNPASSPGKRFAKRESFGLMISDHGIRGDPISLSLMAIQTGGQVVLDSKEYQIVSPMALNTQMSCTIRGQWVRS